MNKNKEYSWDTPPKVLHTFGQLEQVVDLTIIKYRPHWWSIRKKATLYIATNSGVYQKEL